MKKMTAMLLVIAICIGLCACRASGAFDAAESTEDIQLGVDEVPENTGEEETSQPTEEATLPSEGASKETVATEPSTEETTVTEPLTTDAPETGLGVTEPPVTEPVDTDNPEEEPTKSPEELQEDEIQGKARRLMELILYFGEEFDYSSTWNQDTTPIAGGLGYFYAMAYEWYGIGRDPMDPADQILPAVETTVDCPFRVSSLNAISQYFFGITYDWTQLPNYDAATDSVVWKDYITWLGGTGDFYSYENMKKTGDDSYVLTYRYHRYHGGNVTAEPIQMFLTMKSSPYGYVAVSFLRAAE